MNKNIGLLILYGFILSLALIDPSLALTYKIPESGNVIGEEKEVTADEGDNLLDMAENYDIGVGDMLKANPRLSHHDFRHSTKVTIPSQFTLPAAPREGIVLNLAEMRVYFYHPGENLVSTYPVGIGRQGWGTPLGETKILSKEKDPAWYPPDSIRREAERNGKELPDVIPAGPDNPLGLFAMHLGFKNILMHGTNNPHSVGLQSSHGCIRMYADDIEEVFRLAPIGTPVRIIYEPHQAQ